MTYWERLLAEYVGGGDSPISPTLIAKSITTNRTYNAVDDEADGYSSVSVNVPNTSTLKGTLPLTFKTSEEQLRDWTIYGNNTPHIATSTSVLPLTFTTTEDKLRDWGIRGNDLPGTENLLNISSLNSGYITDNGNVAESNSWAFSDYISISGEAVTLKWNSSSNFFQARIAYYDSDKTFISIATAQIYGYSDTFTLPSDCKYVRANYSMYAERTNVMLTAGSTAPSTYIPYQQGVGQRTENLFNFQQFAGGTQTATSGGLTFTRDNDTIVISNTSNANYPNVFLNDESGLTVPQLIQGQTYSGKIFISNAPSNSNIYVDVMGKNQGGDWTWIKAITASGTSFTLTTEYDIYGYKLFCTGTGISYENTRVKFVLTKGSTAPSSYIPYGYEISISCEHTISDGISYDTDKLLYFDGSVINQSPYQTTSDFIAVTQKEITISGVSASTTSKLIRLCGYDENKTFLERQDSSQYGATEYSFTFALGSQVKYIKYSLYKTDINIIAKESNDYTFYIDSPLTAGQSISKTSTGVDIATTEGENTISTTLYNKPETAIEYCEYVGVGEPVNDSWQIPLTISDGTNTTTVNVPIDAPLTSSDSVSNVVDIPTYVGTNTIDTTLVEPVTADIVYVGANSTLINKTVNQNGTCFAYSDNANGYNSVTVAVPNTYTNEDEGKVVSSGELVAQTTTSVTTNGIVDTTTIQSVSVNVPTAGSVTGDVRFLDYDGTVVQAYSKSDFANLTALPANPAHEGLTEQGWNWSLEDAKTYVAAYDKLDIGQMYITNDGKTRLYITLVNGRLNPTLAIAVNGSCDVDWGDGTTHDTLTGTNLSSRVAVSHTYATGGDYVIALTVTGSFAFVGGSDGSLMFTYNNTGNDNRTKGYRNILRGVEIGDGITTIDRYAFANCLALSSITIPDSVTSIADNTFNACIALSSITIPDEVSSVAAYTFDGCYALSSVAIPKSVTLIGGEAFRYCYVLPSVTISNSVTRIGVDAFRYCYALSSVTIPNSVTEIGSYAFDSCYSLSSATIPNSVTTIEGSVFGICRTLAKITIPDSVTSISAYAFSGCATLPSITIPDSVTTMGGNVFSSCGSLSSIVFQSETPPTITNGGAFYNVPTDCIIYVPTGSLADYTSAQYYPSSSTYTYVEY